jgi:hypothetical protein
MHTGEAGAIGLDSITTQAVAFGVLLFLCLVTSQLHSTIDIVLIRSLFVPFTPATILQPGDSRQSIGKEQPVENSTFIGSTGGAPTIHVKDFLVFFS